MNEGIGMKTRVIFREWEDGDVMALLLDYSIGPSENCTIYEPYHELRPANYQFCIARTKPANLDSIGVAEVAQQLKQLGFVFAL